MVHNVNNININEPRVVPLVVRHFLQLETRRLALAQDYALNNNNNKEPQFKKEAGDPPPRVRFKLFSHLSVVVCSADPFSSLLTSPIRIEPAGDRQLPRHGAGRSRDQEVRGR